MAKDDNLTDFLTDVADALRYVYGYNYDADHLIDPQDFSDMIYGLSVAPTGNIQLTTSASTDVSAYATATVKTGSATTPATTITANPSAPTLNTSNNKYYVTVSKAQNVTPSVSAGWVSSGTAGTITVSGSTEITKGAITNNTSGGTSSGTVNFGKQLKVSAGWYPSDLYYTAQNPSGNIQLTTNSSTNVAAYATATVRSASSYSLAITDKSTTAPTMGSYSSGYYSITTSLTGTLTAGTSGWFSSGSATDSSVIVGRLPRVALTSSTTAPTGETLVTVTPSTSTKYVYASTGGYFPTPASNAPRIAVSGDSNLVASNIKQGVSIFGVTGTHSGSSGNAIAQLFEGTSMSFVGRGVGTDNSSSDPLQLSFYCSNPSTETAGFDVTATDLGISYSYSKTFVEGLLLREEDEYILTLTNFRRDYAEIVAIDISSTQDAINYGYLDCYLYKNSNPVGCLFELNNVGIKNGSDAFQFRIILVFYGNKFAYEVYGWW